MCDDLQIIKEAYDRVGIKYALRTYEEFTYLFICREQERQYYLIAGLPELLRLEQFMEFENGKLKSY